MPVTTDRTEVHLHDRRSGRWLSVVSDAQVAGSGRVRIEVGATGNRIDPARRVRRRGYDLVLADRRVELRSWWPVREVRTHAVGQFVDDLRGEVAAAGADDVDEAMAQIDRLTAHRFGDRGGDVTETVLASAYPLLRRPLELGARPAVIPLPLEPLLHHDGPRVAAEGTLGPRVTRPLVRALAGALVPDESGRIAWEPILLARMAAYRCGPEQLASILTTRPQRPGAVSFSLTDIERARAMFEDTQPRRIAEQLVEALESDGGTTELARRLIRHDSRPPVPPAPTAPVVPSVAPRRAVVVPDDPGDRPIDYPAAWSELVDVDVPGTECTVVLPVTGNELLEWGVAMDNCLGAYRMPAATGRTRMIGFAARGQLRYVAEISAGRTLRQLEARSNRTPTAGLVQAILDFLRDRRLIDTDARRAF